MGKIFESCICYSSSGLLPSTQYFYICGDPASNVFSEEHNFTTLALPSPIAYPARIAVVGDLGLTYNSTSTIDHVIQNDPTMLVMIGDLSYANQYLTTGESASCYSCAFPTAPTRETFQPHWDNWGRWATPPSLSSCCKFRCNRTQILQMKVDIFGLPLKLPFFVPSFS